MAKIIITSVSAGAGHVRAANAVEAYLKEKHDVSHIDLMNYSKKWFKHVYADKYIDLINNHPKVWKLLFDISDKPTPKEIYKIRSWLGYKIHNKFFAYLKQQNPDIVVSTHFMPPEILARYREKEKLNFKIHVVVTDFDVHYLWVHPDADHYFVAGENAKNRLIQYGIHPSKISVSGIPIMPNFFNTYDKSVLAKKWNLDENKRTVLLMAGGAGVGELDNVAKELLTGFEDIQIIALPGKNEQLLIKLKDIQKVYGNRILPIGFTNEVHELMSFADLVVTKPGGLSTSECIYLKKPMMLINPIPGQEELNAKNIAALGLGKLSSNLVKDLEYALRNLSIYKKSFDKLNRLDTKFIIQNFYS
jgi:processive 1,2-diacylglycerol beta-glucosyltransferase